MKIRHVRPSDALSLLAIYRPYIESTAVSFETIVPTEDEYSKRIIAYTQKYPWLIAETGEQIVGYAYATKHREREAYQWCLESSVYVHKDFSNRSIAMQLYEKLFELLTEMNFVNVYAVITLPNDKSYNLHRKMGFVPVGIYENIGFKNGAWHSVQWLVKVLNKHPVPPPPPKTMESILHKLS